MNQMHHNARNLRKQKKQVVIKREVNQGFSLRNLERILDMNLKRKNFELRDQCTQTTSAFDGNGNVNIEDNNPLLFSELESMHDKKTQMHSNNEVLSNEWQSHPMSKRTSENYNSQSSK